MAILKPFSKVEDVSKQRAASEANPIEIPFTHPVYLSDEYSKGVTDKCFFLKAKADGKVYPYNSHMAENGNLYFMPHFDLDLLNDPQYAGEVAAWRFQGILPKGYGELPKAAAPAKAKLPAKTDNSLAALTA
jgi:hypothetical protein